MQSMRGRFWMGWRYLALSGVIAGAVAFLAGQTPAPSPGKSVTKSTATKSTAAKATTAKSGTAAKAGPAPRMAWGDPDLQGVWFVLSNVPLERPAQYSGREFLTDQEVAQLDKQKEDDPGRNARSANSTQDVSGAYNAVFNSVLKTGKRTSMVIDPPDGKIPPLVAGVQGAGRGGRGAAGGPPGLGIGPGVNDNPETVAQSPRCLGVPMPFLPLNTLFAQGTVMQIVQSPKSLGIYMEDDHAGGGNRVIYMDGRPHAPASAKFYLGDSRGHWEGNTLVIETTNFTDGFRGSDPATYKMVEHITRTGPTSLVRRITFDDPKTWTKPWTVSIEMGRAPDQRHMIFDSACHEGNYGMVGILVGNRRQEQAEKK